jgi:hypothetical protein
MVQERDRFGSAGRAEPIDGGDQCLALQTEVSCRRTCFHNAQRWRAGRWHPRGADAAGGGHVGGSEQHKGGRDQKEEGDDQRGRDNNPAAGNAAD